MAHSLNRRERRRAISKAEAVSGSAAANPAAGGGRRRDILICALLLLATFAVYAQVGHHSAILYDDPDYVTDNVHVRAGLNWAG